MKIHTEEIDTHSRSAAVHDTIASGGRLGLVTSVDGTQLITLLLLPDTGQVRCLETPIEGDTYQSLTPMVPQCHWFESSLHDMFGLIPQGHPRLKSTHLHDCYGLMMPPLSNPGTFRALEYKYEFLTVEEDGVYEIPVGPIHAGIIEPGHFRFSCFGEVIVNLEIRLGYLHRGVEKRLTEVPWQNTRFVAEAAASDMPVANALACAGALESLLEVSVPESALQWRTIALETERIAMHISDLIGLAGDIGFLGIASAMSRLRGIALGIGEQFSGNRFMRGFVRPGGVNGLANRANLPEIRKQLKNLQTEFRSVVGMYLDNQVAIDRMEGVGRVSPSLSAEFGLVGVSARASGSHYDCRKVWSHALYPSADINVSTETSGDVLARAKVRINEVNSSIDWIVTSLENPRTGELCTSVPPTLPKNSLACSLVESHRGELIHLVFVNDAGKISRYCIKDPSANNWTGLAIAIRNNLVADFPLCNKSFSLSYSGHDL